MTSGLQESRCQASRSLVRPLVGPERFRSSSSETNDFRHCSSLKSLAEHVCSREWFGTCTDAAEELLTEPLYPPRDNDLVLKQLRENCFSDTQFMADLNVLEENQKPAMCMGRDVMAEGCPDGMSMACTADFMYSDWDVPGEPFFYEELFGRECHISPQAICWCATDNIHLPYIEMGGFHLF
jgi:hypothetical protein